MITPFEVDQDIVDVLVAHLQEKGYTSHLRVFAGAPLIEARKDSRILHWDMLLFEKASKEDALQLADSLLDKAKAS